MPTIIESLRKKRSSSRRISKAIIAGVGSFILLLSSIYIGKTLEKYNYSPKREASVVGEMLSSDDLKHKFAATQRIKQNPSLVDSLEEDFDTMNGLEKAFFKDAEKSESNPLSFANPHRVRFDGKDYFSGEPLDENSVFLPKINMVFDPKANCLYALEKNRLIKAIGGVEGVGSTSDSDYFLQGDTIYRSDGNQTGFKTEQFFSDGTILRKVEGTSLAVAISNNGWKTLNNGRDTKTKKKVDLQFKFLSNYLNSKDIKLNPDKFTKVTFSQGRLYLNNEDNLYVVNGFDVKHYTAPFFEDFVNYSVRDINRDGKDDLVTSTDIGKLIVYEQGKEPRSISLDSKMVLRDDVPYRWLNPYQLKSDVKKLIANSKWEKKN